MGATTNLATNFEHKVDYTDYNAKSPSPPKQTVSEYQNPMSDIVGSYSAPHPLPTPPVQSVVHTPVKSHDGNSVCIICFFLCKGVLIPRIQGLIREIRVTLVEKG